MEKSVVIICDQSPIGRNSALESIRIGTGVLSLGFDTTCKVVFRGDAVYLLSKNYNPEALNMDSIAPIFRLMELAELEINILEESLVKAGFTKDNLINYENLKIINMDELAKITLEADASFRM